MSPVTNVNDSNSTSPPSVKNQNDADDCDYTTTTTTTTITANHPNHPNQPNVNNNPSSTQTTTSAAASLSAVDSITKDKDPNNTTTQHDRKTLSNHSSSISRYTSLDFEFESIDNHALSRGRSNTSSVYYDSIETEIENRHQQQQNQNLSQQQQQQEQEQQEQEQQEQQQQQQQQKDDHINDDNNDHDHLLTIVQSSSDAPIVIFHPEQQSEIHVDSEMIRAQKMKQQQQENERMNEQQNDSQHLLLLDDDDDHNDENDDDYNNDEHNNEHNNDDRNDSQQYHERKSSSALEELVQAASRPTFQTIQSCSKLMDQTEEEEEELVEKVDHSLPMNISNDRIIHDIETKASQEEIERKTTSTTSAIATTTATTIKPRPSLAQHHSTNLSSPSYHSNSSSNSLSSMNSFASQRYKIKNSNTGQVYDIRDLKVVKSDDDQDIIEVKYTLFPSKVDLMAIHNRRSSSDAFPMENSKGGSGDIIGGFAGDARPNMSSGSGGGSGGGIPGTHGFSPLKDTRMAISKSTNKAVNRIGKTLSRGKGLLRRAKSEGSPTNAPFRSDQIGSLLEPFPNTIDEDETFVETDEKKKDDEISNFTKNEVKMASQAISNKNENTTTTTTAAAIAQEQQDKENVQIQEIQSQIDNNTDTTDKSHTVMKKSSSARVRRNTKVPAITIPKNTVPVKCVNKSKATTDFNPLLLITTFAKAHNGPIWKCAFSKNGKYLATGGADGLVKIWEIAPKKAKMNDENMDQSENNIDDSIWKGVWDDYESDEGCLNTVKSEADAIGLEIDFILPEPTQSFQEHTEDVVDMSWSDTGYLLTASLDKTVRLWHPTKPISLHMFKHADAVTSVCFHPSQDKYFLSGGFDKKIRIWDITSGRVVAWTEASFVITTATYQPDGKKIAAGLIDGRVMFYSVDGDRLKYFTEIVCKNRSKKFGKKVTGLAYKNLEFLSGEKDSKDKKQKKTKLKKAAKYVKNFANRRKKGKEQVLITSNDSRLRLVGMNDFCMIRKYKGHTNSNLMFKARFSESGKFIIIGSETGKVTIWNTATRRNPLNINVTGLNMYDKVKSFECFDASTCNPPIVTEALFAPSRSAKNAFLHCGLFPSLTRLDHINHDFSSSIIVTSDYEGTIRVFLRRASFDTVVHASGPAGYSE